MAESVVKLRLESGEYDSKIKRAAQNVLSFGDNCRKAGQSMAKADKEAIDYVRSIGQMETVAKNAKGKINEMTNAFTDLSVQYRQLTDDEKKSPFGQAISQSLDQLKNRINESKAQLQDVSNELGNTSSKGNETGGVMQQLASKFTINIDAIKLFNAGLAATKMALDVAKDAFFASEANVDEWGRIVDSSRSLYEGFLNSINNGDISGFLSNISQIVSAAKAAYNELDRLGTMRTIQAPQISAQQTENDRIRMMIQTGRWISAPGKDSLGMKDGQILTAPQIRALEKMLNNGVQTIVTLTKNEVDQAGKAIDAFYTRQSHELRISEAEFRKGTSSMAEFDKRMAGYDAYKKWDAEAKARFAQQGGRGFVDFDKNNPYAEYRRWGTFRVDGDRYKELVQLIQQRDQQTSSMYNMQGQAYRTINRAEGITTRSIMGGGGSRGGTGGTGGGSNIVAPPPVGSIAEQEAKVQALTKAWREASDQVGRDGYAAQLKEAKAVLDEMQGKVKEVIPEGSFKALNQELHDLQSQRELLSDPIDVAITDDMIQQVKDKIDELNGKKKEISEPPQRASIEEQIRTKLSDQNIATDATTFTNLLEFQIKNGLENIEIPKDYLQQAIFGERMNIPDEYWQDLVDQINAKLLELGIEPIKLNVETGEIEKVAKKTKNSWHDAANAIMSVGSALQQLQDPAAKIAGIVGEAIATIALAFAQASAKESKSGIWGWIAATAVGLGTMISTIAAIKSATSGNYAQGGIIPGNSFSGDNQIMIGTNAGELILNRAQQANIAGQLTNNGLGSLHLEASLEGEDIRLAVRNGNRRRGRGEYVESKS